jgi:hypothetical protein
MKFGAALVESLLLSITALSLSAADSQKLTEVIVIGTVHIPTAKFSADDLERILEQVRPAAILFEVDSSFIDPRTGHLTLSGTLEGYAVKEHLAKSDIPVLPYDIEGRNKIYADHHYFELERDFIAAVRKLYEQNSLQPVSRALYAEVLAHLSARDGCAGEGPEVINSAKCDEIEQRKLGKTFPNFRKIIALTPSLAAFAEYAKFADDFWQVRNEAMADNVVNHARKYAGKRIAVLCGFEHRGYLRHLLKEREAKSDIVLKEYWDYLVSASLGPQSGMPAISSYRLARTPDLCQAQE